MIIKNQFKKLSCLISTTNINTRISEINSNQQRQITKLTEATLNDSDYLDSNSLEEPQNCTEEIQINNNFETIDSETTIEQNFVSESNKETINENTDHEYSGGSHFISRRIRMTYEDRQGNITSRLVKVDSFDNHACGGSFFAYCYSKKDYRTFRFDGVIECVNEDTGECIDNIKKYLNNEYEMSPEKRESEIQKKYQDVFDVFIYVAKADGQFRKEEKKIIFDFFTNFVTEETLTESVIEKIFKNTQVPSKKVINMPSKTFFINTMIFLLKSVDVAMKL